MFTAQTDARAVAASHGETIEQLQTTIQQVQAELHHSATQYNTLQQDHQKWVAKALALEPHADKLGKLLGDAIEETIQLKIVNTNAIRMKLIEAGARVTALEQQLEEGKQHAGQLGAQLHECTLQLDACQSHRNLTAWKRENAVVVEKVQAALTQTVQELDCQKGLNEGLNTTLTKLKSAAKEKSRQAANRSYNMKRKAEKTVQHAAQEAASTVTRCPAGQQLPVLQNKTSYDGRRMFDIPTRLCMIDLHKLGVPSKNFGEVQKAVLERHRVAKLAFYPSPALGMHTNRVAARAPTT